MIVLVRLENWEETQIKLFHFGCRWINSGVEVKKSLPKGVKAIKIDENNIMTTSPLVRY